MAPERFTPVATGWLDAVGANLPRLGEAVASGDYRTEVSSVDINVRGLAHLVEASQGLDARVPAAVRALFDRAVAKGHGKHGVASVVEVIRQPSAEVNVQA
ncbi:hypothetical protein [Amycolatopsis sp. NPDC051372]|uniref:imine reductase family protein n=1 Tax=Amycolatopsis sp. NPDC051372 TaxID=3155669 RepID=UPI0034137420